MALYTSYTPVMALLPVMAVPCITWPYPVLHGRTLYYMAGPHIQPVLVIHGRSPYTASPCYTWPVPVIHGQCLLYMASWQMRHGQLTDAS